MNGSAIPLVRLEPTTRPEPQRPQRAECRYQQYAAPLRYYTARWLGFKPRTAMARRVGVLSICGRPVLSATSYLPLEVIDDSEDWHQVGLGELALLGHRVTRAAERQLYVRSPTAMERSSLGLSFAREVPISLLVQPYHIHDVRPDCLRAGVIIRARTDVVSWVAGYVTTARSFWSLHR